MFYKRGKYYWIGDDKSKKIKLKYFGDVPRGMNKYFWLKLLLFWDSISVYSSFNLTLLNGINNDKIQVLNSGLDRFIHLDNQLNFEYLHKIIDLLTIQEIFKNQDLLIELEQIFSRAKKNFKQLN